MKHKTEKKKKHNLLRLVCTNDGQTGWWMMLEKPTICNGFSFQREKTHGRHEKWWQMTQGQEAILTRWRVIAGSQSWNGGMCSAAIAPTGVFNMRSLNVCREAFSRAASDKLKHGNLNFSFSGRKYKMLVFKLLCVFYIFKLEQTIFWKLSKLAASV